MWFTGPRSTSLLAILLIFGCEETPGEGRCAPGSAPVSDVCRKTCSASEDCLLSEHCDQGVCLPEAPGDTPKVKRFEVTPAPVERLGSIAIDYAVLYADRVTLSVRWEDGSGAELITDEVDRAGTLTVEEVEQNGTVELVAERGTDRYPHTRSIVIDDGSPAIIRFGADRTLVTPGETVELSWLVINPIAAVKLTDVGRSTEEVEPESSRIVQIDRETTFILETSGDDEEPIRASVTIKVDAVGDLAVERFDLLGPDSVHRFDFPVAVAWRAVGADEIRLMREGQVLHQTRVPFDLDQGAAMLALPPGAHDVSLVALADGAEVSSGPIRVVVASDQPPVIDELSVAPREFTMADREVHLTASWEVSDQVPDAAAVELDWGGRGTASGGLVGSSDMNVQGKDRVYSQYFLIRFP